MLLVGLTVATVFGLRAGGAPADVRRAAQVLLGVELGQGLLGFVQYFTGVPAALVSAHQLGACLVWVAALRVLLPMWRRGGTVSGPAPGGRAAAEPALAGTAATAGSAVAAAAAVDS
jgi:heme a synthase